MRPVSSRVSSVVSSVVAPVAHAIVALDLPHLPVTRRRATVEFVCRRIDDLPDVTRAAVLAVAAIHRVAVALPGGDRVLARATARPLPLLGEYVRLVRSLTTAYVWETWPDTEPDGRPAGQPGGRIAVVPTP